MYYAHYVEYMDQLDVVVMEVISLVKICGLVLSQSLVQGIVETESSGNPYAVNINSDQILHRSVSFNNVNEAVAYSRGLIKNGYSIDMGLGQINSGNLQSLGLSVEQVFDPCTNLNALQTIFLRGYNLQVDKSLTPSEKLSAAISRYNTGNSESGKTNGYVNKVLTAQAAADNKALIVPSSSDLHTSNKAVVAVESDYVPDGYENSLE
jgi:type IV secretion system protein VirB1